MGQKLDMTLAQGNLANDMFLWNSSNWPYSWAVASFHPYIRHCFTQQMPSFEIFGNMGWQIHTCLPEQCPLTGSWLSHLMVFCRRPLWWLVPLQQASTVWRLLPPVVRWYPAGENKTNSYKPDYSRRSYKPIIDPEVSTYKTDTDVDVLTLMHAGDFPLCFAPRFQARAAQPAAIVVQRCQWKCEVRHVRDAARLIAGWVGEEPGKWAAVVQAKAVKCFRGQLYCIFHIYLDGQFTMWVVDSPDHFSVFW